MSDSGPFDLLVVGSGFGGAMAAAPAVMAGKRVLMIEAGDWLARGPENWSREGFAERSPCFNQRTSFDLTAEGQQKALGQYLCVGGASVVYGGVAIRLREADFEADPVIDQDSGAAWPYRYRDLEPFYAQAEALLQVAGNRGEDPTEPPRSTDYPQRPGALASVSVRIAKAATALGLHPFRLPLAINYLDRDGRTPCAACGTCDGYACAIRAKNDVSTVLIPKLQQLGLELATNTMAVRLEHDDRQITGVFCTRAGSLEPVRYRGRTVAVAAGALATPRLLLASGLDRLNPAGDAVGRYLMRHCNAVVMGAYPFRPAPHAEFHKQLGIHDFYFGHPNVASPPGRLGCIQQFATPAPWVARDQFPLGLGAILAPLMRLTSGFIVMAEDRPRAANRVALAANPASGLTLPKTTVTHDYDARDLAARAALVTAAKRILRKSGALFSVTYKIRTFSHAIGTVRLGLDPLTSPLDHMGAFRGIENLFVTDGSALPRAGGVNPSLTIAANALRTGSHILERL